MEHRKTVFVNLAILAVAMIFLAAVTIKFGFNDGVTGTAVKCDVECSSDADCDDNNELTRDVCLYPKDCSSKCFNVEN